MQDWRNYKYLGFASSASYHALGLRHDPNRGEAHILFKLMEYLSQGGKNVLDRFRVVAAGVFRIKNVYNEIEKFIGYNKGEGEQTIKEMFDEFNNRPRQSGRNYSTRSSTCIYQRIGGSNILSIGACLFCYSVPQN